MSHYKSNVRDQIFNLFEVLGVDKALGQGEYSDLDADTVHEMLTEMSRLAEGPIAASFVEGDRNPPVFDPKTHSVTLPEAFKKSVRAYHDGGWDRVGIDETRFGSVVIAVDCGQFRLRAIECEAWFQARKGEEVAGAGVDLILFEDGELERPRNIDIDGSAQRQEHELRGKHAGEGIVVAIERERAADGGRVGVETAGPEFMADDGGERPAWLTLRR